MVHKTCPRCNDMLPVASKQCHCGYVFMARKTPTKPTERKVEIVTTRLRPERAKKNYALHKSYIIQSLGKRAYNKGDNNEYDADEQEMDQNAQGFDGVENGDDTLNEKTKSLKDNPDDEKNTKDDEDAEKMGSAEGSKCKRVNKEDPSKKANHGSWSNDPSAPRRPRGRPKGSKDKRPRQPKGYREMGFRAKYSMGMCMDDEPFDQVQVGNGRQRFNYDLESNGTYLHHWMNDTDDAIDQVEGETSNEVYWNMSAEKREIFKLILEDINSKICRQNFKPD